MKCTLLAVLALVGVASASISPLPLSLVHPGLVVAGPWSHGLGVVHAPAVHTVHAAPAVAVHAAPAVAVHAAPVATVAAVQSVHSVQVPAVQTVHAAPAVQAVHAVHAVSAIQPGYVAATRGSVHVAPLPGNTPYASHHLNTVAAPGTH